MLKNQFKVPPYVLHTRRNYLGEGKLIYDTVDGQHTNKIIVGAAQCLNVNLDLSYGSLASSA